MNLNFNITTQKDYGIIHLKGHFIGKEAEIFLQEIDAALAPIKMERLVIDLSNLEYIGSQGAAALTSLGTRYQIVIAGASPKIISTLQLLKLDQYFMIYPTIQEAANHLPHA